jgi:aminopeptidase N
MYPVPQFETLLPQLEKIASSDDKPQVRARAIMLLSSYNNAAYVKLYEKGLNEKAYSVVGASLSAYLKTGNPDASQKAKALENSNNLNILVALANYYLEVQDKTKYSWFKSKMNTGDPKKVYNLLVFFGNYLTIVTPEEREDGKKILKQIEETSKYDVIKEAARKYLEALK